MNKIIINGDKKLKGRVNISGSKNESLAILCAALLSTGKVVLKNIPNIKDISVMKNLIENIGSKITSSDNIIIAPQIINHIIKSNNVGLIRNSILLLGPLIAKRKKVIIPVPGGCNIGSRPINLHLEGLKKLGVDIKVSNGLVSAQTKELRGAKIKLGFPSVGATESIMITATVAEGQTIIYNAARESEVQGLARFLNQMGADIKGMGTDTLVINGKKELSGTEYSVSPDRIETITYMILGSFPGNEIRVENTNKEDVCEVMQTLRDMCVSIENERTDITVRGDKDLKSANIIAKPFPNFPTDAQALITPLLCSAKGESSITDNVFPERFTHIKELRKMGAHIILKGNKATIFGQYKLKGAKVICHDLRGGMALILAGLVAKGKTIIENKHYIDRGYENYIEKLQSLGADINVNVD